MPKVLILSEPHGRLTLQSVAKETLGKGEILVKNVAVALNPIEWKQVELNIFVPFYPFILGADIAGIVEEVGEGVQNFKKGDKVYGLPPRFVNRSGAYQEYTVAVAELIGKIPDNITFAQAATIAGGAVTAALGLFRALQLPAPFKGPVTLPTDTILIWGASTSVGAYAVQLARIVGFKNIIATSSPSNFDYVTSLGATRVFDYKDPSVFDSIKSATGNQLSLILDANGSHEVSMKALGEQGGDVASTLSQQNYSVGNVNIKGIYAASVFEVSSQNDVILMVFIERTTTRKGSLSLFV